MSTIEQLYRCYKQSTGVSTDTRTVQQGNIWFALKGPNFNANKFADQAIEKGAAYAVVDDAAYVKDERYLLVDDGLKALQGLATHHRNQLSIPFMAITGSNGKTTTKELMRDVLATKYNVLATRGNLNNHIGVPLTILSIDEEVEFAIIEMGANKVGDIAELCAIADPDYGLITNIGRAHLEGFGGVEGVIRGKTELYHHLIKKEGRIFVNSNAEVLKNIAEKRIDEPIYYPNSGDFLVAQLISDVDGLTIQTEGKEFKTQLTGRYNFENICAALCVGKFFGVSAEKATEAVAHYVSDNNRSQLVQIGTNQIVLDAYNANPSSMEAALRNVAAKAAKHKIVVLGDMLELGDDTEKEHAAIGQLAQTLGFDEVVFCGKHMASAKAANTEALYFEKKEALKAYFKMNPPKDSLILIKGSRGMSLETLLEDL
ncbi:UDP-N-acetylmuramoyl-tripeptide--D-alanyl-D-alanine ligase [Roseivirga pacifica]